MRPAQWYFNIRVSVVLVRSVEMGMFGQNCFHAYFVTTEILQFFLFVCSTDVLKLTGVKLVFYQF